MQNTSLLSSPPHLPAAQAVAGGTYLALCQDCLYVASYRNADLQQQAHRGDLFCPVCSGDFCACGDCIADAEKLIEAE